ncbi:MAG TPA: aminotransferase class I/II-fold pyridoxal phosphate-dependent enzyme, partial [Acidimicrobiales bacterium]|nr:aminotransferase class I/II-fold pyridoxal phosphate-dependent enzyme [Acidimicrobiales bacterium]
MSRIYLSAPDVGVLERKRLLEALDSGWVAPVGPDLDAFEREVAERAGVPHAVALSSGTAALHLAMLELGVTAGDDVLLPTLTFVASANVIRYVGARPVLLDVDGRSWQLDAGLVAEELRRRARRGRRPAAVLAVDLYGQTPDYDALEAVCQEYEIPLVED